MRGEDGCVDMNERMQIMLGLMPQDAVLLKTQGSSDWLLWCPNSRGYVSEYNPWQAGLYEAKDECPPHSQAVKLAAYVGGWSVQDGTPLAILVDEITRLRSDNATLRAILASVPAPEDDE